MPLQIGKRYRLIRFDGRPDVEGVVEHGCFDMQFRPDGERETHTVSENGHCYEIGTLFDLDAPRPPLLGDDPGSLGRFRRVFAGWNFSNGT